MAVIFYILCPTTLEIKLLGAARPIFDKNQPFESLADGFLSAAVPRGQIMSNLFEILYLSALWPCRC